ncbi:beta-ketoacyl-ACP synthase III [Thermovenabulum gondwanense]|uniref:Beta-ketoacyl-[acyl-carrier-protein] synthase III n=1 Tax=Thermovenabulum gondwanense TaxID=520767 RepID=A0A162MNB0_9FIRM|nr:beta-ketoacyl-ACP synthase III [Thermovenabulum gondwanense]KYO66774.1 3-oxoacyl-[acyl-carrier-protein] synthase 3 [Thermovenabulum gondwanense]
MTDKIGILGVGSFLPDKVLSNFDLELMVDTSDEWIKERTGISFRRIAEKNIATSDMAYEASKEALKMANLKPEEIDLIIGATVTPDMLFPSSACLVQQKLKAKNAACFDLSAGCTGFIYALVCAYEFIKSGMYNNVLIFGSETLSRIVDWEDRNTCVLFGDGAGACVIGRVNEGGIIYKLLGADGTKSELLYIPAGGSKEPATIDTIRDRKHYIKMNGKEVFRFAVSIIEEMVKRITKESGCQVEEVDYFLPHQANMRIIDSAFRKLNIPIDKVVVNLDKYGNMSAASIPVALDEVVKSGKVKKNDKIMLLGFGAGLTWGGALIEWGI